MAMKAASTVLVIDLARELIVLLVAMSITETGKIIIFVALAPFVGQMAMFTMVFGRIT